MAKRFGGFTPEQMGKIIPEMQGMQADEQAKFLASQPGAAARVGKMAEIAQKRIGMAVGGYVPQQQQQPQAMAQLDYNRLYQQPNPAPEQTQPIEVNSLQPQSFAVGGVATNTPNTTGGFNTVEPTTSYTPIEGLPTAPEGITETDYAPFRSQIAGGTESNVTGIDAMFATGNLPENPTDYEVTGSSGNQIGRAHV